MSVVELQTLLDRSTKNMGSGMNSVVKESALELIKRAYKEGIYVQISSGFRSFADQNALYAQGRTKSGNVVTNARGGYSNHNFGLAIDYFLVSDDGSKALWTVNDKWKRVAAIGKELGFSWGGDWKSFPDYPHLEMTGGLTTAQLRAGSRPRLVSKVYETVSPGVSKPAPKPAAKPVAKNPESIVDYLKSKEEDSSFKTRKKIADLHSIKNYTGTAAQNEQLLKSVKKNGIYPKKAEPAKPATKKYPLPDTTYWVKNPKFQGEGVRQVQEALASIYFYPEKGAKNNGVDGVYYHKTANAVKRFQSVNGLKADGEYGPKTKKVLDKKVNK
ncbi:MAG: M15 family metallopeptidase [Desemzia incerta]|uniref:M15 family metallopeptidase n=1 Tax=Desemzia incerta TaxID=82801 RepID=UPI003315DDE2